MKSTIKLLRYPGGKQRLLGFLLQHLPEEGNILGKLVEPFVGGAAVFFALNPQRALLSDLNEELITLYKGIQKYPEEVWDKYSSFSDTKEEYYKIRDSKDEFASLSDKAARTLYLNRTCFKGMWRYNSEGVFNIGYGGQDRRRVVDQEMMLEVAERLKNAVLEVSDFEEVIDQTEKGDFIFLDPPYRPGKKSLVHAHYVYGKFSFRDHKRLSDALIRADQRGVRWAMTTSSHKDILRLFNNWDIIRVSKGTGSKIGIMADNAGEVLVRNYLN